MQCTSRRKYTAAILMRKNKTRAFQLQFILDFSDNFSIHGARNYVFPLLLRSTMWTRRHEHMPFKSETNFIQTARVRKPLPPRIAALWNTAIPLRVDR